MSGISIIKTLPSDANGKPIPIATGVTMLDATGTPQVSPIAAGTSEIALVWPTNAIRLYVYAASAAVGLRGATGTDGSGLATIPVTSWFSLPGVPGTTTYIKRPNSTAVDFVFEILV